MSVKAVSQTGERPVKEEVQVTHSMSGQGEALTQVTTATDHVTIDIPPGKGGILYAVSVSMVCTPTTSTCSGGAVEIRNSAADWDPFFATTGVFVVATEGAGVLKPFVIPCFKKLPGNSQIRVNYTPYNAQSQYLEVTAHWIKTEADPAVETFMDIVHPLYADRAATTNRIDVVTSWVHNAADFIHIPQGKEGTLKAVFAQLWPCPDTSDVTYGGRFWLTNDAHDVDPVEFYSHMYLQTTTDTSGSGLGMGAYNPMLVNMNHEVKHTSNYRADYQARAANNQTLTYGVMWERPYRKKQ